ncbi:MAG TPA: glycosyltransferase [Bryobacteraceae bacterium]|jgi:1,2-diacylglycerol 3-beta-galactosyltransferase
MKPSRREGSTAIPVESAAPSGEPKASVARSVSKKVLELVFFDAGGGHRSAANALSEVVRRQERPWDLPLLNLQELLDEMDVFRKLTGVRLQDLYNLLLRRGWTLGSPALMKGMHGVIRALHSRQVRLLSKYWRNKQPNLIVSLIPNFNRAIYQAMRRSMPNVPLVTILTDMADYPPHFWIERQPQYFICGTERAYNQALKLGHTPDRLFRTSGMILNPRFYEPVEVDRGPDRVALGLDPNRPTALMMFGGEGSAAMLRIARLLDASRLDVQIIAICGKSKKLEAAMRAMPRRIAMHVEGFTREIPRFMRLSDFFIGKPGPGSISEAVAMGLPVIIERNRWTLPQERYNADWVEEQGVGISVRRFKKQIVDAVRRMLDSGQRCEFVKHVQQQRNRAVFEIPDILEQILSK